MSQNTLPKRPKPFRNGGAARKFQKTQLLQNCVIEIQGVSNILVKAPPSFISVLQHMGGIKKGRDSWQFSIENLARVLDAIGTDVTMPPSWVLVALGDAFRGFSPEVQVPKRTAQVLLRNSDVSPWPVGMGWPSSLSELKSSDGASLLPYQLEAVQFGLSNGGRVLLADEMGLGKTAQALALAVHYVSQWPLLVVAPASLCSAWADEALRWLPVSAIGPGDHAVQVLTKGSQIQRRLARIVIVSYDLLAKQQQFQHSASGKDFEVVICDEAHFLKSVDSQRSRAILPMVKRAQRAILITGTPAVNNAADLYPVIDALLPGLIPSQFEFLNRYCLEQEIPGPGGRRMSVWRGSKRPDELYRLLLNTVMMRRLKAQVLSQLPSKRRQRVKLDSAALCVHTLSELASLRKELCASLKGGFKSNTSGENVQCDASPQFLELAAGDAARSVHQYGEDTSNLHKVRSHQKIIAEMARLTCEVKIKAVTAYVECIVSSGARFLLFAHHRKMMDALEQCLAGLCAQYIRIDGSTPLATRASRVQKFQSNDAQVALLSITACGQGLNLQSASTVVFAELHWVVGQMLQAEDRVHRVGQTSAVNIQYLLATGTLDDAMYETVNRKHKDTTATLDGQRCALRADAMKATAMSFQNLSTSSAALLPDNAEAQSLISFSVSTGSVAVDSSATGDAPILPASSQDASVSRGRSVLAQLRRVRKGSVQDMGPESAGA